jgi:hypothetical protein
MVEVSVQSGEWRSDAEGILVDGIARFLGVSTELNQDEERTLDRSWSRWGGCVVAGLVMLHCGPAVGQFHHRAKVQSAAPSRSLTFLKRDGSCVDAPILKIEPKVVTVRTQTGPVTIARQDLLQVSQGGSLVYSARSSWADVQAVHLLPRESFMLKFRNGKAVEGRPFSVTANSIVFKRTLWKKKRYAKDRIATVDYLRIMPESDAFDSFAQDSPAMLFFFPEFYDRLLGVVGRIPVRLYDAVQPEDDAPLQCPAH